MFTREHSILLSLKTPSLLRAHSLARLTACSVSLTSSSRASDSDSAPKEEEQKRLLLGGMRALSRHNYYLPDTHHRLISRVLRDCNRHRLMTEEDREGEYLVSSLASVHSASRAHRRKLFSLAGCAPRVPVLDAADLVGSRASISRDRDVRFYVAPPCKKRDSFPVSFLGHPLWSADSLASAQTAPLSRCWRKRRQTNSFRGGLAGGPPRRPLAPPLCCGRIGRDSSTESARGPRRVILCDCTEPLPCVKNVFSSSPVRSLLPRSLSFSLAYTHTQTSPASLASPLTTCEREHIK